MHSEQVNASQLLASFLGSENDRISRTISRSDFAGELKKLIREPANGASELSKNVASKSENSNVVDSGAKAYGGLAAAGTKTRGQSAGRVQKAATDSKAKINELKSKAKAAESVFVTNSAVANTVLADLQYPAETRQACKALQNKQGAMSVKDLKSFLDNKSPISSAITSEVPAEHVKDLVDSIIAKGSGTGKQGAAPEVDIQACVQVKTEGSYTRSELLGLLDKILQHVESAQSKSSDSEPSTGRTQTAKVSGGLKASQTRSLTASALPSFVSGDSEHSWTGKTLALEVKNPASGATSVNVSGTSEDSIEAVSDKLEACSTPSVVKTGGAGYGREAGALGEAAGNEGGGAGSAPDVADVSSSARQRTAEVSVASLDSILKSFDARIVSTDAQQAGTKAIEDPVLGGSVEGSVAQAQNMASHVKGAEKEADRSLSAPSASRQPQNSTEHSETGQIKAVPAEYPSSEWSFDSDQKGAADSAKKNEARTPAAKFDIKATAVNAEAIGNADGETAPRTQATQGESLPIRSDDSIEALAHGAASSTVAQSADSAEKAPVAKPVEPAEPEQIAAQPQRAAINNAGKAATASVSEDLAEAGAQSAQGESLPIRSDDSIEALAHGAASSTVAQPADSAEKAPVAKLVEPAKPEQIAVQPQSSAINNAGKAATASASVEPAAAGTQTAVKAEPASETLRMGPAGEDFQTGLDASVYGAGTKTGLSVNENMSAATGINPLKTAQSPIALSGEGAAVLGKQIDKQLGNGDSIPEGMVSQNSASSFQGSDMNVPRMENSAQNGSTYDPYRSSEFIQNMREQFASASGRQLVLEMEPTELGKISLKVGAKKDEISVVALTDNESARQALMKHSPELRQGLRDQGLVLDKFMVDVNSDKSGSGNYPEDNNPQGQNPTVSKMTKTSGIQAVSGPAYISKTDVRSQINIFA
jgi:flagellar hook-length control protein FliK